MIKKVLYGKDSRDQMLIGVKAITDAVRVTMGSNGKCVLIGNSVYGNDGIINLPTIVSKDGWTVTKYFELSDPIQNRGAMLIKEAATKTVEQAGDATTCTCVLAESLITNGMKLIDEGTNSQQLIKGMDKAIEYVVEELKKMSTPVKGDLDRIRQIATVSANNDTSIGDLIAEAYSKIGEFGVIEVEPSRVMETTIKVSDGFKIDRGWVSPLFINNKAKEICEFEDALVLLYDKRIIHHSQIEGAINHSINERKPLLIICEDSQEEGLAYLAINSFQGSFRACVVKAPEFGELQMEWMEDIALTTGATFVSDLHGIDIKEVELSHLGKAQKVTVSKNETVIRGGNKDETKFDEFIGELQMNLTRAKTEDEKYPIEKRIARLKSSIAILQIGAATETELNEKLDRVDDSVRATKAAISEGFLAGGGTAFLRINNHILSVYTNQKDFQKGIQLVLDSLSTPFKQICLNAGIDSEKLIDAKTEQSLYNTVSNETGDIGYDALSGLVVDMVDAGIIDSAKALRCALVNAVSVAKMLLTSECSIISTS